MSSGAGAPGLGAPGAGGTGVAGVDVTGLLHGWAEGAGEAEERLLWAVYGELRQLAQGHLRRERQDHTLETSALVHEAYLRLADQRLLHWRNRAHFFSLASHCMRRVLVDYARRKHAGKRDAGRRVSLDRAPLLTAGGLAEVLRVDEALRELARRHPGHARVVELRYFGGLSSAEIGSVVGLSVPTVTRRWRVARAWLYRYLSPPACEVRG